MFATVKKRTPLFVRDEIYKARRLGPSKYARYTRLERAHRRTTPMPQANAPFDIGAPRPIVVHETTVHDVTVHWVTRAQGIRELRAFKQISPGHSCFLDIGAAEGIFSAAFCALTGAEAWAFEPSPKMYSSLNDLISVNPDFRITPTNIALGNEEGTRTVEIYEFDAQFRGLATADANGSASMTVRTLDGFVEEYGIKPDLAKIDAEGMEIEILRGGERTFRESVDALLLEVHADMLMRGERAADLQALLTELGFELFTLESRRIADLEHHIASDREEIPGVTNIVCRKRR